MWKSNKNLISALAFTALILGGCNKKTTEKPAEAKTESASPSVADEVHVAVSESYPDSFGIQIEGYKATKLGGAIYSGSLDNVKELIQKGASIEKCLTDETYVYDALYTSIAFSKMEILAHILQSKLYSDINKTYSEDAETPLTLACAAPDKADALQAAQLLVSNGANVDGSGNSGGEETKTPLFIAIKKNHAELVRLLLDKGANRDIKNESGANPLAYAEENGFAQISEMLK